MVIHDCLFVLQQNRQSDWASQTIVLRPQKLHIAIVYYDFRDQHQRITLKDNYSLV